MKFPKYIEIGKGYRFKIILDDFGASKFGYIDFENRKIYCNRDNPTQDLFYHLLTIANHDAIDRNYYLQHPPNKMLKYLGKFLMELLVKNGIKFNNP
jgi:hypothetical protein